MKFFTKIIREVLKQFYIILFVESIFIKVTVNNIYNIFINFELTELFKIVYILMIVIIVLSIVIGLFSSNYRIKSTAILITGGFLMHELFFLIMFLLTFRNWKNVYEQQRTERFVDNFINFLEIKEVKKKKYFAVYTIFNTIFYILEETSEDSLLKFSSPCIELSIYIIIYAFSNRLISIDKTLIFLVLTIMSFKTCFKSTFNDKKLSVCFKITKYDILNLITFTIIFILSSYVKLIRDILVNVILSVFYSIILSLLISIIYYGMDDLFYRLKLLLLDENISENNEKFQIEFIFLGCFILYLTTIFFTWKLFWKKKTIVKMSY
ncbi:hypothetical protein A0H76_774 [Hepatospora eriocheir]|uniref:Uncharacterized protein n=1 Tax=Hepatospora eriocheir TaxID=1081669 RepID=A0A1X0QIG2_9MICR|nr:hypothetical protein A0H76_774 [Hepatospora eriocheir]